jgi:cyclophilin family peptidyl-prolyl cis-trans isomerase
MMPTKRLYYVLPICALLTACARPIANFSYAEKEHTAPATVRFDNRSEKATAYEWDFGDGSTSTEASPQHRYTSSGNHLVRLRASKGKRHKTFEQRVFVQAPNDCLVEIETEFGNILLQLSNATPQHRDNFLKLADEGFYDSLAFHRIIEGFMVQGGDPDSRTAEKGEALGTGGPGYEVPAEFVDSLIHLKGALAAARMPDEMNPQKKSSGSQFYIVQGRPVTEAMLENFSSQNGFRYTQAQKAAYLKYGGTPQLDRQYSVFGKVLSGLDVLDKIAAVKTDAANRPLEDVRMKMRVIR